jgi:hypothetical protein
MPRAQRIANANGTAPPPLATPPRDKIKPVISRMLLIAFIVSPIHDRSPLPICPNPAPNRTESFTLLAGGANYYHLVTAIFTIAG